MKKGVLLVNMGGAGSPEELKLFLARMFSDPFILPFGKTARKMLALLISNTRYKKSWKKYEMICGSPIIDATFKTKDALQAKIGGDYLVKAAFSYSAPFIKDSISAFAEEGVQNIIVIPLYPQSSFTTTSSVEKDVNAAISGKPGMNIRFVKEFYKHEAFVSFWSELIEQHIERNQLKNPYLLFSAHSIPEVWVGKGDTYPKAIEESAGLIAAKSGYKFGFAFQSGMKRTKWVGPDVKEVLKQLADNGTEPLVIIPISFVNENLETKYDIDYEIIPYAVNKAGLKKVSRVDIPVANETFIGLLAGLIQEPKTESN